MSALQAAEIVAIFNTCFRYPAAAACRMARGGNEPLYHPAVAGQPEAYIYYARDLAQSCIHEAAHWLYAGPQRRLLCDYGYWYIPDGRNADQQQIFEQHEIAIQAREWILSQAAGTAFRVSADNLVLSEPSAAFRQAIVAMAQRLTQEKWSTRMQMLSEGLAAASGQCMTTLRDASVYTLAQLQ